MSADLIVRLIFWFWFAGAAAAGHFLLLQRVTPVAISALALALAGLLLSAYFRIRPLRAWVDGLDLRSLVLVHVTRFVGIYFLALYQRGELPRDFAVSGGMSDIIVATGALVVAFAPLKTSSRRRAIVIWNVFGLIAVLVSLFNITRLNLSDPTALSSLTHLPLSFLPTMLVPLLLTTHVIIFVRTAQNDLPEPRS